MTLVAPTNEEFAQYLGMSIDNDTEAALRVAVVLIDDFIQSAYRTIPQEVYFNEVCRTGHAVYKQAKTVGGSQVVQTDVSILTTRFASDPLAASYKTLRRYVLPL